MKDITLADLQQITSDIQDEIRETTNRHIATLADLDLARERMYAAHRAFDASRDKSRAETAFINLNARAPRMLAEICHWKRQNPKGVITEIEFSRASFAEWRETLDGYGGSSRTGVQRAIEGWYYREFQVWVRCWLPIPLETNWELAMGETGRLYLGFSDNSNRISTRLKASNWLPF